ncbi:MAG: M23 family metallopeptidase [Oscillospiraceae bacterium]|jgi:murein DD-endopeptidase MepM/ murein hydrolase activator NlpD|nr:M23 family metallopeptidase [Oscillospiraceae bacterium]
MSNEFTTSRTARLNDSRANTFVSAAAIRPGFQPAPAARPRFSWGLGRSVKHNKKKPAKAEPLPEAAPARYATTFTAKSREEPAAMDGVTRLSARVTPNSLTMYSAGEYGKRASKGRAPEPGANRRADEDIKPLRFGERMLRNTAVCVAVLLCALAIKTVDAPIARTVSAELRDWVTMDLDESLGSLKFVQNLLPEAALVFWHIGTRQTFSQPSQAALSHGWNESEPYLAYASETQNPVYAAASGEVAAITYLEDNEITVRLRHDDGMETVYGNLASCTVREGDLIAVGDVIGASGTLYFEIRGEGRSMNPAPLMAERQP